MKRRTLSTAAAFAVIASSLLTACGSDDKKPEANDKIVGAEQGGKKSASPRATASDATGRPKIELPADIKYVFEWSKTGDKVKDAVLSDGEQFIKATDMAVAEQDPSHKAYTFYSSGEMSAATEKFVQRFVDNKARTTGTYRFYDESASLNKDGTASLIYCEDQEKAFNKFMETGKVDKTLVTKDSYMLYNTVLRENKQGIWIT